MRPDLIAASFTVLRQNKQLMVFPVLSATAAVIVAAAFAGFAFHQTGPASYLIVFAWYCLSAFGVIFFNCALAACARECLSGGQPTVAFGLQRALDRIGAIFVWALIASTVGMILRSIGERAPLLGKIAVWLLGAALGMTTYLVVPVIVAEDRDAVESIRRSAQLLRDTWGPQLTAGIRFGWRFLLFVIPGVIIGAIGATCFPPLLAVTFLYIVVLVTAMSAANGIFEVALYRYAAEGSTPQGWSPNDLSAAFHRK